MNPMSDFIGQNAGVPDQNNEECRANVLAGRPTGEPWQSAVSSDFLGGFIVYGLSLDEMIRRIRMDHLKTTGENRRAVVTSPVRETNCLNVLLVGGGRCRQHRSCEGRRNVVVSIQRIGLKRRVNFRVLEKKGHCLLRHDGLLSFVLANKGPEGIIMQGNAIAQ